MSIATIRISLLLLVPLFAGCATAPKPLQGEFAVISAKDIAASGRSGDPVRWGGIIIGVEPEAERTCIQILSRELTDSARPRDRDVSDGRFIACRDGFYDPEIFTRGREVTVVGNVAGITRRPVGDYAYPMPEVAANVIYLWPERREIDAVYVPYSPWIGGWPYGRWGYGNYHRPYRSQKAPAPPARTTDKGG